MGGHLGFRGPFSFALVGALAIRRARKRLDVGAAVDAYGTDGLPDDRHLRAVPDLAVDGWTTISLAGVADADIAVAPLKVRRAAAS